MSVNLSGQMPGEQLNGLLDMQDVLLDLRTPEAFLAVVVVERAKRNYDDQKQAASAVVRLRHIEPVEADTEDAALARQLLERQYARRTGNESLPMQLDEPGEVVEPELDLDSELADRDVEEPETEDER